MRNLSLHDRVVVQTVKIPEGIKFPHDVVGHPGLTTEKPRAIRAAWASDACAVPDMPTLRELPGTPFPVTFSSIQEARERLDNSTLSAQFIGAMKRDRSSGSSSGPRN